MKNFFFLLGVFFLFSACQMPLQKTENVPTQTLPATVSLSPSPTPSQIPPEEPEHTNVNMSADGWEFFSPKEVEMPELKATIEKFENGIDDVGNILTKIVFFGTNTKKNLNFYYMEIVPQSPSSSERIYFSQETTGEKLINFFLDTENDPDGYYRNWLLKKFPKSLVYKVFDPQLQSFIPPLFIKVNGFELQRQSNLFWIDNWQQEKNIPVEKMKFSDPVFGQVFLNTSNNAIMLQGKDGIYYAYSSKIPFLTDDQIPEIDWKTGKNMDGTDFQRSYTYKKIGGCGAKDYANVVSEKKPLTLSSAQNNKEIFINPETDFVEAGTAKNGEKIFELKDKNHAYLKDMWENKYVEYDETRQKTSYEEFLNLHPVFFWKDGLERWIMLESNRFIPQAECGKPVIYLYPEKEEKVSVKVSPQGGMSVSIPEHGKNGWEVLAKPSGELTLLSSGEKFPYLFWEGRGGMYQAPQKGWVVANAEVEKFLKEKLSAFGFNEKEIADFLEFWLPKFEEKKSDYFFIGFLGTKEMNRLAPLEISPKPDQLLRVLMDFHTIEFPYSPEPQKIPTFERKGFVVTEWGGVLQ